VIPDELLRIIVFLIEEDLTYLAINYMVEEVVMNQRQSGSSY
jgi:hypothetical protein